MKSLILNFERSYHLFLFLLFLLLFLPDEDWLDVWLDSSSMQKDPLQKSVQLLVVLDGEHDVPRDNHTTTLTIFSCDITCRRKG